MENRNSVSLMNPVKTDMVSKDVGSSGKNHLRLMCLVKIDMASKDVASFEQII